jgi:8-oxo-dGTP pyrophosphatase MutT (NUDIX family)
MKHIIVSGSVIIEDGKLLVTKDHKDEFYKIPGGTLEKDESLENCAIRELEEETGFCCEIIKKISTMNLSKNPQTKEEMKIELHHYLAKIKEPINYSKFEYNNHKVKWLKIEEIKQGKHHIAPNIKFLIEKGDIK